MVKNFTPILKLRIGNFFSYPHDSGYFFRGIGMESGWTNHPNASCHQRNPLIQAKILTSNQPFCWGIGLFPQFLQSLGSSLNHLGVVPHEKLIPNP